MHARTLHFAGPVLLAATLLVSPARGAEFTHDAHNKKAAITSCDVCHKPQAASILPDTIDCRELRRAGRIPCLLRSEKRQ